jgi:hypothetical protein
VLHSQAVDVFAEDGAGRWSHPRKVAFGERNESGRIVAFFLSA